MAPENTPDAFMAADRMGADGVELAQAPVRVCVRCRLHLGCADTVDIGVEPCACGAGLSYRPEARLEEAIARCAGQGRKERSARWLASLA